MQKLPPQIERQLALMKEQNAFRTLTHKPGLIDFASNDYLGLAKRSRGNESLASGSTGSRLLTGQTPQHAALEQWGATQFQGESALLFNSGYMANLGVLSALPGRHDTIHYDAAIHASIKDGMRLSLATKRSFPHQDLGQLEKNLRKGSGTQFVMVEALYSMDGDWTPLPEFHALCEKYDAFLIVDEAHSTGLVGPQGAGWSVETATPAWLRIHTFGKAIGRHGALVVAPTPIREYLINRARPFIYTTAMSPRMAQELLEGLQFACQSEAEFARKQLVAHKKRLLHLLGQENTSNSHAFLSPIFPWLVPGNDEVKALSADLEQHGLDVRAILAPTVPAGKERLRIVLHSYNTEEQIEKLAVRLLGIGN